MFERWVKWVAGLIIAAGVILAVWLNSQLVQFWTFTVADVWRMLTPLVLIALFIERALEVLLTPWQGEKSDQLTNQLRALRGSEQATLVRKDLTAHKAQTRQLAFLSGLAIGAVISAVGVRALQPFAEPNAFAQLSAPQRYLFIGVDVLLSAALLAGGADGIHKVMTVFTTFFDTTSEKLKNAAPPSVP